MPSKFASAVVYPIKTDKVSTSILRAYAKSNLVTYVFD